MPRHVECISPEVKASASAGLLFQLSSDEESSDSQSHHSHHSHRHVNFLRPQFSSEYSPKKSTANHTFPSGSTPIMLSDLPEIGPISNMSQTMLSLAMSVDNDVDEKSNDDEDSFQMMNNCQLMLPSNNVKLKADRVRSLSVILDQNMTAESIGEYSSKNIRKVVGKRRASNTRLVKSLATGSFFVYGYLSDDDRSLTLDGLLPAKRKRHSFRHRIQIPITEDEEQENYQNDLIKQNKNTEFLEVFGPSPTSDTLVHSLRKKL